MTVNEPAYSKVDQADSDRVCFEIEDDAGALKCDSDEPHRPQVQLLFFELSWMSPPAQFAFITFLLFAFSLLSAALDEFMFTSVQGFRFPLFMTTWELFIFSAIAVAEAYLKKDQMFAFGVWKRSAPIRSHALVALSMSIGRAFGNTSLQMLNFPTQVVFKSTKLVIVMLISLAFHRDISRYSLKDYAAAASLTSSAAMFALGDSVVSNKSQTTGLLFAGIAFVLSSLVFSSIHTNYQELILNKYNASVLELLFFGNLFGAAFAAFSCIMKGELLVALAFCIKEPRVFLLLTVRSCAAYMGVLCFVVLIKRWNCVVATTVTTCRKICTIILSFWIFPKPFTSIYIPAAFLFVIGTYLNLSKEERAPNPEAKCND